MFDAIHLRWIVYWTKRLFFWLGSDRPWRMYSRGRSADSEFSPSELLYFRFLAKNLDDAGGLGPAAIRSVDQSVNRQKYSKPFDVLIPEPRKLDAVGRVRCLYQGVAAFPVGCVPADLKDDKTASGFIGLQVHGVGGKTEPMQIRWRKLRIIDLAK